MTEPEEHNSHTGASTSSRAAPSPAEEPYPEQVTNNLLEAFELLARRGSGSLAWSTPFLDDPIAFLLDTMSDATSLWDAHGDLLFCNRAAAELGVGVGSECLGEILDIGGRHYERRCVRCHVHGADYMLEIVHEISPARTGDIGH